MFSHSETMSKIFQYDYIRFAFCDINGECLGPVLPSRHAVKHVRECGNHNQEYLSAMHVDMSICGRGNQRDKVILQPDVSTLRSIPWAAGGKFSVAEITCEFHSMEDKFSFITCPRSVARQQLKRLEAYGLELYSGFELEYFLFHVDGTQPLWRKGMYLNQQQQNRVSAIVFQMEQNFWKTGVDIEKMHVESAPSMLEAALHPREGIASADAATNFKHGVKEMANDFNMTASFISEIVLEGIECYLQSNFNHSVISKETQNNVFFDKNDNQNLSSIARMWLAGLVKHGKALAALTCPTVNCYPTYNHEFVPKKASWQVEDRRALMRIKNTGPEGTYFENRMPSGLSNPYIVLAATVAAGIDGMENELKCPPAGEHAFAEDLPKSLSEALDALESDEEIRAGLGEEFVAWYDLNRRKEASQFAEASTASEKMSLAKEIYL